MRERFFSRRVPNGAVSELIMQEMLLTTEQVAAVPESRQVYCVSLGNAEKDARL